ncbi:GyrI-like domain-containing protein [Fontibacillus sp. BL9]|uniref:GyrI-like domain-containing protein n=1 Tax=Fontibacillus sp. BL9 TaxID=3389971 RepID=UPI003978FEDE
MDSFKDALAVPREEWHWKLLIRQPDYVTAEAVEKARNLALAKLGQTSPGTSVKLHQVAFENMEEGSCVQMLHQGPFADEPRTLAQIHSYIEERGFTPTGKHHEIYLSDYRKTAPDKLRTILRQPVK